MSRQSCLIIAFLILTASCDRVYREWEKDAFRSHAWTADQEIAYHPTISDITKKYDLILGIRHIHGARIRNIPVRMRVVSPSGKELVSEYNLEVMTADGAALGKCAGDICDFESRVGELVFAEPGDYQFHVSHRSPSGKVTGIMELGVILEEQ